ncbi:acyl-CoA dehydrogenase family protein [Arthrobacter ginkgonis]|uniref:Acyl-CoA dehydrogenase family protein n=1 Tax=Arthrobacter ginkgonis TaxID=1630594 RepID=A0ABP7CE67_9MICC
MTESLYSRTALSTGAGAVPGPDELVARAIALRPRLRELQDEHAALGSYNAEIHRAFTEAGLYNILRPSRYGGFEYGLDTFFRVAVEISRGDPGVGWSFVLGSGHTYQAASYFPEKAQSEIFSADPFVAPSRAIPHGQAQRVDGGFILNGTWDYNSGCTWSTHAMPVAPLAGGDGSQPELYMFVLPRPDYSILGDWGGDRTIGLQASSSNSIRVENAFVPEHMAVAYDFKMHDWGDTGTEGFQLHGNPLYLGRSLFFFYAELISTQVGTAWAALDEYQDLLKRGTSFPPRMPRTESPEYQRWYGKIMSLTEASQTLLMGAVQLYTDLNRQWAEGGKEFTPQDDARLRGIVQQAAQLATKAVDLAFTTAGSSAARNGSRMQKYHRDASMYRTHIAAQFDAVYAATARFVLGGPLTT